MKRNLLLQEIQSFTKSTIFILLLLISFTKVFGQTNTWDGSSSNNWNTASNWSLDLVPTAEHDVVININAAILVDASSTINSLTIGNNAVVSFTSSGGGRTITIENTGSSIAYGSTLTLQGSTGSGARSMTIAFSGTGQTMLIAGNLILTAVGEGSRYIATNSITTVTGTITKSSTGDATTGVVTSTAANLSFLSGGTYVHGVNGNTIPYATWDANSYCNITGITSTISTVATFNQLFGHFTWNCTTQSGAINFNGNLRTVNGNFTVSSTNNQQLRLSSGETQTLNVSGNFTMSAGILNFNSGAATFTMNVAGNFTHSGGTITETSSGVGAIVFNGTYNGTTGMQTYTSGGTVANTINFTVSNGAYLQMAAIGTTVTGGGTFTLQNGGTLGITSPDGITATSCGTGATCGNIRTTTRTFNTGADYIYNAVADQNTGNGLPASVSNLIFDNSGGVVTLNSVITVTNNFSITTNSIANLGTFSHSAGSLTLGGAGTTSGSWGHTNSPAINKNNDFFANNTGIINVSANTCSSPAAPTGITPSSAVEVCTGTSINLNATSSGNTINWFTVPTGGASIGTSASGADFSVSPSVNTTYYAETQTPAGCISVTRTATALITVNSQISNNNLDIINGTHDPVCSTADENTNAVLTAPAGTVFISVDFASYGTPDGTCQSFTLGGCNAATSISVCEGFLLGNNTATIPATNGVFTDPCVGTFKRLYVQANYNCTQVEICEGNSPGTISGMLPTGGNGTYTYLWESSTTNSSSGFGPASGTNNAIDYTPGTLTQTTWFRRTITSGGCNNTSAAVEITVNPTIAITNPGAQNSCDSYTLPTITGTNLSGNEKYYNNSQALGGTIITGSITSTQTVWIYDTDGTCSDEESFLVTIINRPSIDAISTPSTICANNSLNPSTPTVTANGSAVTAQGWQLEIAVGGGAFSNLSVPYTVAYDDNGKKLRYYATNTCGTTNSNEVILTVNPLPNTGEIIPD